MTDASVALGRERKLTRPALRQRSHGADVEKEAEESHAGLRPGFSAAFGVEKHNEEHLVLVAEVRVRSLRAWQTGTPPSEPPPFPNPNSRGSVCSKVSL